MCLCVWHVSSRTQKGTVMSSNFYYAQLNNMLSSSRMQVSAQTTLVCTFQYHTATTILTATPNSGQTVTWEIFDRIFVHEFCENDFTKFSLTPPHDLLVLLLLLFSNWNRPFMCLRKKSVEKSEGETILLYLIFVVIVFANPCCTCYSRKPTDRPTNQPPLMHCSKPRRLCVLWTNSQPLRSPTFHIFTHSRS